MRASTAWRAHHLSHHCAPPRLPAPCAQVPPDFIAMLGLQQALTPSRNNGFLNMFKLMQARWA